MTHGDILFLLIFAPLAVLAIVRSARGDGEEIPSGKQLSALAIAGLLLAVIGKAAVWIMTYGE